MQPDDFIEKAFSEAATVLEDFMKNKENLMAVGRLANRIIETLNNGGKILSAGNGGSMCDAMHFAEELTGRFRADRRALPAISASNPAHITCVGNDYGFDSIFSRFVEGVGVEGDLLISLSTSGNSPNIIKALESSKNIGVSTFSLLGGSGGRCRELSDDFIVVPSDKSDRIQEIHIKILHTVIDWMEHSMFPPDKNRSENI